jgi:hypothetical protein
LSKHDGHHVDTGQVNDRGGHRFAKVEKRTDAIFLDRPVVGDRNGIAGRLRKLLCRTEEHADDLAWGAEVKPCQVRARRGPPGQRREQSIRIDLDPILRADENQIGLGAGEQH